MTGLKLLKVLAIVSALVVVSACSQKSELSAASIESINQLQIKNLSQPDQATFAAGQPSKEEFRLLAESGIKHVVNLRSPEEQDWDEGEYVESLGMQYYSIPVAGAGGVTVENATALATALSQIDGEPALVHCASSNRVGALIALRESALNGMDTEEAIAQGKLWGLASLEPVVREKVKTRLAANQ